MSLVATLLVASVLAAPQGAYRPTGPRIVVTLESGRSFTITTDPKASPKTVAYIQELCASKFYDRQRIHRSEPWVVQWGAPASKDKPLDSDAVRSGGSGKQLPFEESLVDYKRGVVGVASTGLQVGGDSQLFILRKDTERLWRSYAVVGLVTEGMDVVDGMRVGTRIRTMRVVR
ncbi:MAG: peptidylprolyl isomerase [Fimbriimonadaceae bacterium]|nr:peptidylprolyl isomerase [Fimbriimonadaceae bacterium]